MYICMYQTHSPRSSPVPPSPQYKPNTHQNPSCSTNPPHTIMHHVTHPHTHNSNSQTTIALVHTGPTRTAASPIHHNNEWPTYAYHHPPTRHAATPNPIHPHRVAA